MYVGLLFALCKGTLFDVSRCPPHGLSTQGLMIGMLGGSVGASLVGSSVVVTGASAEGKGVKSKIEEAVGVLVGRWIG
jgi:hypothetical protein